MDKIKENLKNTVHVSVYDDYIDMIKENKELKKENERLKELLRNLKRLVLEIKEVNKGEKDD